MGLDNGIELDRSISVVPSYIKVDEFDGSRNFTEICYWRKCWGIRNEILCLFLGHDNDYDYCLELTTFHVRSIRRIIRSFMNQKKWEEDGLSIWSYSEIRPRLTQHWKALWWLEKYMRENPDAKAYFYDSY